MVKVQKLQILKDVQKCAHAVQNYGSNYLNLIIKYIIILIELISFIKWRKIAYV